jgi:hypothetical protein
MIFAALSTSLTFVAGSFVSSDQKILKPDPDMPSEQDTHSYHFNMYFAYTGNSEGRTIRKQFSHMKKVFWSSAYRTRHIHHKIEMKRRLDRLSLKTIAYIRNHGDVKSFDLRLDSVFYHLFAEVFDQLRRIAVYRGRKIG